MTDPTVPWSETDSFALLCDLVAEGNLVALTGAGLSRDLEGTAGERLPGWRDLLVGIADDLLPTPDDEQAGLIQSATTGSELIELASMLNAIDEDAFTGLVRERLRPKPLADQPPDVTAAWRRKHDALIALDPLGIVTMNIDELHESEMEPRGWDVICPLDLGSEAALRAVVRDPRNHPFVLQAHGALSEPPGRPHRGLVFTWESYRELVVSRPAYTGFMVHLFTSASFLFVGYGLSDLDFDQLVWQDAARFGASVRDHVVLEAWPTGPGNEEAQSRKRAASAIKKLRYGINTVWMTAHEEVAEILEAARTTPGPRLRERLDACFDDDRQVRREAHDALRAMGEVGKAIAAEGLIAALASPSPTRQRDEAIYSLGRLEPNDPAIRRQITNALLDVALTDPEISPVAHALSTLHSLVRAEDLHVLERISTRMRTERLHGGLDHKDGDPEGRLPVYAEYLVLRVRARDEVKELRPPSPLTSSP